MDKVAKLRDPYVVWLENWLVEELYDRTNRTREGCLRHIRSEHRKALKEAKS